MRSVPCQLSPAQTFSDADNLTSHGDHWHCEGPAVTDAAASATATGDDHDHDHDHENEDHASGSASLEPSPTESVGCEP
jgi:hypothetical protein